MFDFGIGSTELIVLGIIALIVIGPRDLPKVLRTLGQVMTKVRGLAREFQGHIEDAARDTGLDDLKKDINKATSGLSAKSLLDDKPRTPGKVDKPAETPKPAADKPAETPKPAAETSKPAAEPAKSGESKA
jgi:sec-independent protein translocase protein TatB